ncbi:DNA primase/helicase [Acinetobacter phage SH-Ab 15599]|nr:DNA primase/helicase [Acinetobacter phage SH-Ab 15599]
MLYRQDFTFRLIHFIKPEYFSDIGQRNTFKIINAFYLKYKAAPTKDALLINLNNTTLPEAIYEPTALAIAALYNPHDELSNEDWMFDESEKWAKERALFLAMSQALAVMNGEDKTIQKDGLPELLQQALAVRFDQSLGHDYIEDAKAQWDYYQNPAFKIAYSQDIMNKVTQGGNTRKTLSIVQAGINVGKTTWMLNIASDYAKQGLNGIYFTLEIAEEVLRERVDVKMFGESSEQIRALDSFAYLNRTQKISKEGFGKLVIKQFPASTVHVGHLRHFCREFEIKHGKKPDFIVVDYLTLLNSAVLHPSSKSDSNTYYTQVAEELRALMVEMDAIGWSAQQFNRTGQDEKDPKLSNSGLSIGVQATSDFTVAFVSPNELKAQNKAIGIVLKNRFANKQHIPKFAIGLNDDLQIFFDLPEGGEYKDISDRMDEEIKEALSQVVAIEKKPTATHDLSSLNFGQPV